MSNKPKGTSRLGFVAAGVVVVIVVAARLWNGDASSGVIVDEVRPDLTRRYAQVDEEVAGMMDSGLVTTIRPRDHEAFVLADAWKFAPEMTRNLFGKVLAVYCGKHAGDGQHHVVIKASRSGDVLYRWPPE